ncbi:SulP family inorganic anion transporter [Bailinhaonella thermotolerans]|uniref:Carbonic anhydrase n=1 Tax=Bailinhaonella thermotolerans TaxID=1070861 RepID=A0A3A4BHJ9_9ACTN|nr:bifunctional SulP family inorganic anion transporter/carbonic anhydrase [Bailinhaonella thermotolerans]RJL34272.1 carbonic anhydrase [Bailinhaonella thermotolerans]
MNSAAPTGLRAGAGRVLRHDLSASLVVFLVAVPLSLGIAVASGAPLLAGLIAAVVGGVVAGALGGSAVQVSGPAAGLTLVVAELVATYGWRATCMITVLAGLAQFLLGMFRVARGALAVSPAVVHGMLAGVGVVIALAQLHIVLGGKPQSSALENVRELPGQLIDNHTPAVAAGLLTIAVLLAWTRVPARLRIVPAPLAALVVATTAAWAGGWDIARVHLPDSFAAWNGPLLPEGSWQGVAGGVAALALLAGVESLLCAIAADRMHDGPRVDLDRELAGQGVANMVSGSLGGLPVAGVIVRTTVNARAGARSRWSTIMHGCWVLLFSVAFASVIELIPMAALAALLVFIGVQMVNLGHVRNLRGHRELPVYLVTMGGVVVLGLAEGVLIGLGLAAVIALRRLTRVSVEVERAGDRWHAVVAGSLTFLSVPRLTERLRAIPSGADVDLSLNVDFMDHGAFEAIHAWRLDHERGGGTVDIDEIHEKWYTGAATGTPPRPRKALPGIPVRWWLPWPDRGPRPRPARDRHPAPPVTPRPAPADLLAGTREYHATTAPLIRPVLTRMVRRQTPNHLFITCADARVVPNLITSSGPGDLFTVRNIGNLVPRHGAPVHDDSVAAALEYATEVLKVRTITICGHSGCGAMGALLSGGAKTPDLPGLDSWLQHGHHTLARFLTAGDPAGPDAPAASGERGDLDRLCRLNVIQQLDNVLTHPRVRRLVEAGDLELVGLYFDIASARVHLLDQDTFRPIRHTPSP